MVAKCPADNTASVEQDQFWDGHWDAHKVGWLISGCAAAVTCALALITILGHARNYNRPLEQRQIIRVLLLAPVYAVFSFLSYRFFRTYDYWSLVEAAYEAFAIASFLMLMLQYIGDNVDEQRDVFIKKDKKPLPIPFCCWRYRPSKAYFLVLLKWSVIQYVIVRPALSIVGVVTEYYEVYCTSSLSYKYAYVYTLAIDFVSISIALYGLIVLYTLVKEDLQGRRPLAKFLTIKLVVFFVFYQGFVFDILTDRGVIKATEYWTTTNISDGLSALCVSCEMVLISGLQMWAFYWGEYHLDRVVKPMGRANKKGKTNHFRSILHALNFSDFFVELWHELRFLFDRIRGKEYTRADARYGKFDIVGAFNASDQDGNSSRMAPLEMVQSHTTATAPSYPDHYEKGREESQSETGLSKQALLADSTPPAQSQMPAQAAPPRQTTHTPTPAALDVPATSGNGRISPKPRSPRDSTGRYPSFLYDGNGSVQNAYQQGAYPNQSLPQSQQPRPVDQNSWANPGAYSVRGFPRNSAIFSSTSRGGTPEYRQEEEEDVPHRQGPPHGLGVEQQSHQVTAERPRSWEPQAL